MKHAERRLEGFTVIELVFSFAVLAIAAMIFASWSQIQNSSSRNVEAVNVRDELVWNIRRFAGSIPALKTTMMQSSNTAFRKCVDITYVGGCINQVYPLALYPPNTTTNPNLTPIAGPGSLNPNSLGSATMYTLDGQLCTAGTSGCVVAALAWFRPQCAPLIPNSFDPPSNCTTAEFVEVFYEVRVLPMPQMIQAPNLKTVAGSVITAVNLFSP